MKNKIRFPDFLGIGAARTGSTWLYHNLIIQSGIWLPPNKELHYFDRNIKYPSPSFLHDSSFWKRLIGREAHNRQFRQIMARKLVKKHCSNKLSELQMVIQILYWKYIGSLVFVAFFYY